MIDRYQKLRLHVNRVIFNSATQRSKSQKYLISEDEAILPNYMLIVLRPFKVVTVWLSDSKITKSVIYTYV